MKKGKMSEEEKLAWWAANREKAEAKRKQQEKARQDREARLNSAEYREQQRCGREEQDRLFNAFHGDSFHRAGSNEHGWVKPEANVLADATDGCRRLGPWYARQSPRLAAGQARPGDQCPRGLGLGKGANVGSARAGYSSASEYVRVMVIMPSASNCSAAMSISI